MIMRARLRSRKRLAQRMRKYRAARIRPGAKPVKFVFGVMSHFWN